jgi:hypothetical protein
VSIETRDQGLPWPHPDQPMNLPGRSGGRTPVVAGFELAVRRTVALVVTGRLDVLERLSGPEGLGAAAVQAALAGRHLQAPPARPAAEWTTSVADGEGWLVRVVLGAAPDPSVVLLLAARPTPHGWRCSIRGVAEADAAA